DLALGAGKPRNAVHQEQDMSAGIPKMLGDGGCHIGGLHALHRRTVGGGRNDDGFGASFGAKLAIEKFANLAAALADQADDDDLGIGVARDFREQARLADARLAENTDALAAPAGEKPVDRPYTELNRLTDERTGKRIRRLGCHRPPLLDTIGRPRPAIER